MEQHHYELLRRSTLRISVPGKTGYGTGFFVAPSLILTCAHVVKAAQPDRSSGEIYWNGQSHTTIITLSLPDPDLALFQVIPIDHPWVYHHEEEIPFETLYSFGYSDDHSSDDPVNFNLKGKAGTQGERLKFKTGQVLPCLSSTPILSTRTGYFSGVIQITRDRMSDLEGGAIPIAIVFQAFPEIVDLQRKVHLQDRRWVMCLAKKTTSISKALEAILPYVSQPRASAVTRLVRSEFNRGAIP